MAGTNDAELVETSLELSQKLKEVNRLAETVTNLGGIVTIKQTPRISDAPHLTLYVSRKIV